VRGFIDDETKGASWRRFVPEVDHNLMVAVHVAWRDGAQWEALRALIRSRLRAEERRFAGQLNYIDACD
jgi:hypothetical protein